MLTGLYLWLGNVAEIPVSHRSVCKTWMQNLQVAQSAVYCGVIAVIKIPVVVLVPYVKTYILTSTVSVTVTLSITVKTSEPFLTENLCVTKQSMNNGMATLALNSTLPVASYIVRLASRT